MDIIVFENDKTFVIDGLGNGEFDYIEVVSEVFERRLFEWAFKEGIIKKISRSYPTPRQKQEVPLWLYVASDISIRLHGTHSFHSYPWVIRSGWLLDALGPEMAKKKIDPETGNLMLERQGFNRKNHYPRQAPCDQDYLV